MTVPDPSRPGRRARRSPSSDLDPMPFSEPPTRPPFPPDPSDRPGPPGRPGREPEQRLVFVAAARDDRRRHVVDVASGELGDPTGLRALCGAAVEQVVPGLRAEQADCPQCRMTVVRADEVL